MNSLTSTYTLVNGVQIPCVGFGTWQTPDGKVAEESVIAALASGYRHIDTAAIYGNEQSVGDGIKKSGVPRDEIFITTKLWNDAHAYDLVKPAFETSMKKLGIDVLDLYLIHWPNPLALRDRFEESMKETWMAMEELYKEGKIRAIGVSNFRVHHLEYLETFATIRPMVNQIRIYPGSLNMETIEYCKERDILLQAYSPLGTGRLLGAEKLIEIADKYKVSVAQLCIRWSLQKGFNPLPKSVHADRIKANADVFGFEISKEDMDLLTNVPNYGDPESDPDNRNF